MSKIIDYISFFFIYFMLALWIIGTVIVFVIEMAALLPFVLIEESYKHLKIFFKNKKPLK